MNLDQNIANIQQQSQAKAMIRNQHLQLTFQIYSGLITQLDDDETLEMKADRSMAAATIMFKKLGMIKEN